MKNQTIRAMQGDVQLKSLSRLPNGAKQIINKPVALGEHSGHMHILTGDVRLFELNGVTYAAVGSDGAMLQHVHESNFNGDYSITNELPKADHKAHTLVEGVYEFFIQNAYNPYKAIMEKVID